MNMSVRPDADAAVSQSSHPNNQQSDSIKKDQALVSNPSDPAQVNPEPQNPIPAQSEPGNGNPVDLIRREDVAPELHDAFDKIMDMNYGESRLLCPHDIHFIIGL